MKIIRTSNYDKEEYSHTIAATNVNQIEGAVMAKALNNVNSKGETYYRVVPDEYKLYEFKP